MHFTFVSYWGGSKHMRTVVLSIFVMQIWMGCVTIACLGWLIWLIFIYATNLVLGQILGIFRRRFSNPSHIMGIFTYILSHCNSYWRGIIKIWAVMRSSVGIYIGFKLIAGRCECGRNYRFSYCLGWLSRYVSRASYIWFVLISLARYSFIYLSWFCLY